MVNLFKNLLTLKEPSTREERLKEVSEVLAGKLQEYAILSVAIDIENEELKTRATDINRDIVIVSERLLALDLAKAPIVSIKEGIEELSSLIDDFKKVVTN